MTYVSKQLMVAIAVCLRRVMVTIDCWMKNSKSNDACISLYHRHRHRAKKRKVRKWKVIKSAGSAKYSDTVIHECSLRQTKTVVRVPS